jgi:hypothetical protein
VLGSNSGCENLHLAMASGRNMTVYGDPRWRLKGRGSEAGSSWQDQILTRHEMHSNLRSEAFPWRSHGVLRQ